MSRDLAVLRMRQQLVTAVLHVLAFAWFATHYDGRPLARLPFVPFEFVQKLSRRGLTTANPSDCSIYFLYSLCMMSLKPNLQKALGFAPPPLVVSGANGTGAVAQRVCAAGGCASANTVGARASRASSATLAKVALTSGRASRAACESTKGSASPSTATVPFSPQPRSSSDE